MSAAAAFCAACGQAVAAVVAAPAPSMTPVAPVTSAVPAGPAYTPVAPTIPVYVGPYYAGFWLRFVAYLIDGFVAFLIFVIILIPLIFLTGAGASLSRLGSDDIGDDIAAVIGAGFIGGFFLLLLLVGWLYYALAESSSWQGTVGKKILNLYVTDLAGQPISFGRASGRFFARIVTKLIPLGIGYMMAGFTEKKQAIHDMIASCLVLRRN